jgi:RHS repeat-associated protein
MCTLRQAQEPRLKEVKTGATVIESYLYDPDGLRTKKVAGSTSTYYINQFYEVSGSNVTKYYYFGGQRIAVRQNGVLSYLHGDRGPFGRGSTELSTDTNPTITVDVRQGYYAYGRYRSGGVLPTDHKFTGQKIDAATGLYYYGARYYDRDIGAFLSPMWASRSVFHQLKNGIEPCRTIPFCLVMRCSCQAAPATPPRTPPTSRHRAPG